MNSFRCNYLPLQVHHRATATKKHWSGRLRFEIEYCERKVEGKSCKARQAVHMHGPSPAGGLGGGGGAVSPQQGPGQPWKLLKISHISMTKMTDFD